MVLGQEPHLQSPEEVSWGLINQQTDSKSEEAGSGSKSGPRLIVSCPPPELQLREPTIDEVGIFVERSSSAAGEGTKMAGRIVWVNREVPK